MATMLKVCAKCGEEFEFFWEKPGRIDHCLACSTQKPPDPEAVKLFRLHGQSDQMAQEVDSAEVDVLRARLDNDPDIISKAAKRLDKVSAKHAELEKEIEKWVS